jgi:monoamine oxidase
MRSPHHLLTLWTIEYSVCETAVVARNQTQVVIIGAGASGLAAMRELDRAGYSTLCLEARNRIGGRIFTHRDALIPVPVELGAEFVHGRPPEIWEIIREANLTAFDTGSKAVQIANGRIEDRGAVWERIGRVMQAMRRAAETGPDMSFDEYIRQAPFSDEEKGLASAYVEGFNAARKEVIGIASLAFEARASEEIDGDRSFRIFNGYESIPLHLLHSIRNWSHKLHLNCVVERIHWRRGSARVEFTRSGANRESIEANAVLITAPLGVLQSPPGKAGAIRFDPEPDDTLQAANRLAFGQVVRIVFRLQEAVWQSRDELADAGFLLSDENTFRTWWTTLPIRSNIVVAWASGPRCDRLLQSTREAVIGEALDAFARILGEPAARLRRLLEQAHYHNWHADTFSRGAYSYVPACAQHAREALAAPVGETLFFAGEAAETGGHSATVHGAIAAGRRAARQLMDCLE